MHIGCLHNHALSGFINDYRMTLYGKLHIFHTNTQAKTSTFAFQHFCFAASMGISVSGLFLADKLGCISFDDGLETAFFADLGIAQLEVITAIGLAAETGRQTLPEQGNTD